MIENNLENYFKVAAWSSPIVVIFLLILSAFFSGSETALTASSRPKLRSMSDRGSVGAKKALDITNDNESLIGTILLGNNIVNILATSLATAYFVKLFGDKGIFLATFCMTVLILVFSELLPKTYAINNPETAARRVAPLVLFFIYIFSPIIIFVRKFVQLLLSLIGLKIDPSKQILASDEIAGAIALHHSEGSVKKGCKRSIVRCFRSPRSSC